MANVLPCPHWLFTLIVPPKSSMSLLLIERPWPVPSYCLSPASTLELLERFEKLVHLFALDADACDLDADSQLLAACLVD